MSLLKSIVEWMCANDNPFARVPILLKDDGTVKLVWQVVGARPNSRMMTVTSSILK